MYDLSTDSPEKLYTVTNFANFAYFVFDLKNTNNKEYLGHIMYIGRPKKVLKIKEQVDRFRRAIA